MFLFKKKVIIVIRKRKNHHQSLIVINVIPKTLIIIIVNCRKRRSLKKKKKKKKTFYTSARGHSVSIMSRFNNVTRFIMLNHECANHSALFAHREDKKNHFLLFLVLFLLNFLIKV